MPMKKAVKTTKLRNVPKKSVRRNAEKRNAAKQANRRNVGAMKKTPAGEKRPSQRRPALLPVSDKAAIKQTGKRTGVADKERVASYKKNEVCRDGVRGWARSFVRRFRKRN